MTNKSYAINMSLVRIGVLAAQIAVSPSAAAQWRDFLIDKAATGSPLSRAISHMCEMLILCACAEKRTRGSLRAN